MVEFFKTLAIATIPAIITGVLSFLVAHRNAISQIKIVKENNKHEIDRLMEQHKIDIDSLKEKYRLEAEEKEREHNRKLEVMQKEYEYKLGQQESEVQNELTAGVMKEAFSGLVGGMFASALNNSEVQKQMTDSITNAFKKRNGE